MSSSLFTRPESERFTHDCDSCKYVGSRVTQKYTGKGLQTTDWYVCERACGGSVIERYGSEGPDYTSAPISLGASPLVQDAIHNGVLKIQINPDYKLPEDLY